MNRFPISVVTPSYNYAHFINDAILSVQNQEGPVEHIIQDALSADSTAQVVEELASDGSPILFQEADEGQSDALNKTLDRISGTWVGWLNADEFYLPGAFAAIRRAVDNNPDATVIFGDCLFVDEGGNSLRLVPGHVFSRHVLEHYGCFVSSCTVFIRADVLKKHGFDTNFRRAMDWDLWLRILDKDTSVYIKETLAAFRIHSAQVTNTPESEDEGEFRELRAKHGIEKSQWKTLSARLLHIALKTAGMAYLRQLAVRRNRGDRAVWWSSRSSGDNPN